MLPALSTKPKQAMRQVKGLTNDSIDAYSNTPMGGGSVTSYADNTVAANESSGALSARAAPPSTGKPANGTGRSTARKGGHGDDDGHGSGGVLARVVRDRKASGDEELTLKAGDVVRVLSTKRTGYLKCEFADDEGYVPSSYLEFFDEGSGGAGAPGDCNDAGDENQRAEKRKKKKEKRHKDKKASGGTSDPEEAVTATPRSPRKANGDATGDEGDLSPRKSKKKSGKKHRHGGKGGDDDDADAPDTAKRGDETERRKGKKHKKKRHHESSESSESEDESARHRKSRRHRRGRRRGRGHSDSDSDSSGNSYNSSSDSGYTSRRRRRHRHHRKGSSSDDDEYDSDKRKSRHRSRRRGHSGSDDDGHGTARSARRSEKKRGGGDVESTPRGGKADRDRERDVASSAALEKGVAKLDVHNGGEKASSRSSEVISDHTPEHDSGKKAAATASASTSGGAATATSSKDRDEGKSKSARSRKDDESRTESSVAAQKAKTNLGKQIGDKMRSLLGGGKKTERSHKSSSGILNACPGTTQGEEGWYEHGENERYYFVLLDGKWSLLYGPMTEEDFETYSNKVLEQNRMVELPPTYLHKAGYFLNQELRVQKL